MRANPTGLIPVLAVALASASGSWAQSTLTGSIGGIVQNALGIPQMGASVTLFNRLEKQVARVLTDDRGVFQFDSLPADMYSLRVSLMTFLPAVRSNIAVQPGIRRVLSINVASVLSTIELVYSLPVDKAFMTDDWKWTLRGTSATRPILRVLAGDARDPLRQARTGSSMFTHTRGVVKVSAGDAASAPTLGSQPDLGTAFALATSFMGKNHVEFSGNLGYGSQSGNPSAGFRTTFSRSDGETRTPEVSVTMRQIFVAGRGISALASGRDDSPTLRTMSVGISDRVQLTDAAMLTYGATTESVQFFDRVNYVSPFARLSYDFGEMGVAEMGYSSGLPPTQLYAQPGEEDSGSWALFPRVSVRGGIAHIQRTQNYEIGYRRKIGSRTVSAGAYRESVNNAALTAVDADGAFPSGELLPDLFSTASIFNAGRYETNGYMASVQQSLGDRWNITMAYGQGGVLEARNSDLATSQPGELRSSLAVRSRHMASTQLVGVLPGSGTRFTTAYQFMNGRPLTAGHYYITQRIDPGRGLNIKVRQPLPGFGGIPGKLEATAEIRNALGQGYQPVNLSNGRRLQLVQSPKALRGGLAFIF